MVSYLKKVGKGELNKYAYLGSGGAVVASLILGLIVQSVYGELKGVSAQLFEGAASLTAVVVLTYMIFWMTEHSKRIRGELQEKIDVAITKGELFGITILAFIAVFREGLETVLFLTAAFFLDPDFYLNFVYSPTWMSSSLVEDNMAHAFMLGLGFQWGAEAN